MTTYPTVSYIFMNGASRKIKLQQSQDRHSGCKTTYPTARVNPYQDDRRTRRNAVEVV